MTAIEPAFAIPQAWRNDCSIISTRIPYWHLPGTWAARIDRQRPGRQGNNLEAGNLLPQWLRRMNVMLPPSRDSISSSDRDLRLFSEGRGKDDVVRCRPDAAGVPDPFANLPPGSLRDPGQQREIGLAACISQRCRRGTRPLSGHPPSPPAGPAMPKGPVCLGP